MSHENRTNHILACEHCVMVWGFLLDFCNNTCNTMICVGWGERKKEYLRSKLILLLACAQNRFYFSMFLYICITNNHAPQNKFLFWDNSECLFRKKGLPPFPQKWNGCFLCIEQYWSKIQDCHSLWVGVVNMGSTIFAILQGINQIWVAIFVWYLAEQLIANPYLIINEHSLTCMHYSP